MTTGTLTAATEEAETLERDVMAVLSAFHRQAGLTLFRDDVTPEQLAEACRVISADLHKAIGGRYVPKRDMRAEAVAQRNAAIFAMFTGRNRAEVMRHFGISRRLFYLVIAQETRRRQKAACE